jgi:hypothetical protein
MHKYTRYILGKSSQGRKPQQIFSLYQSIIHNVNDEPWHASGKTSEGEGNIPKAKT